MRSRLKKSDNFYIFITHDKINQNCLRIPTKFIGDHRKKILLTDAILTVSDNKDWLMTWMVSGDGKVWFKNGWPEFSNHYRLSIGHLLIFNYLGKSLFHVRIFDQTSCEINYVSPAKCHISNMEINRFITQDPRITPTTETWDQEIEDLEGNRRTGNTAFELAKSFESNKPFYSVTLNGSYIQSSGLYVPVEFMRRYLTTSDIKCVDCVLEVSDGRKWGPIPFMEYKTYGKMYGDNWKKFRDDNHLAVGDVCVFELIDEIEKVLKVTFFRDS